MIEFLMGMGVGTLVTFISLFVWAHFLDKSQREI